MQNRLRIAIYLLLCAAATITAALAQEPAAKAAQARVLGVVTSVDGRSITIKTDAGASSTVALDEKTNYLRVPPGEQDLKKAAKIALTDVSIGDRVLARSRVGEDQKPGPASSIIVMSKADLDKRQEAERLEWQKRGVSGTITAINPDTKEIIISARSRGMAKPLVIEPSDKAQYRRYATDSIRFSDAKPSLFAELKVGDQLRVLGDKNADETRIKPEMVISGSFHNIAGTISSVDAATGEIKIKNLQTKQPMMVKINPDSNLRRIPPMMAMMLTRTQSAGSGQGEASGGSGAGRGQQQGAPGSGPGGAPTGDRPRMGAGGSPTSSGSGMRMRGGDFSQMMEQMPTFNIADLKVGDAVILAASTAGSDPGRVTAITLLAGVEPLLTAPSQAGDGRPVGGTWNFGDINIVP